MNFGSVGAFGFSGPEFISGFLGRYFDNKDMRANAAYQAQLQYDYALRSAREMPAAQMEGYRNAGLNPILAASSSSSFTPSASLTAPPSGSSAGNFGFNAGEFAAAKQAFQTARANKETAQAQAESAKAKAEVDKNPAVKEARKVEAVTDAVKNVAAPAASAYGAYKIGKVATKLGNNQAKGLAIKGLGFVPFEKQNGTVDLLKKGSPSSGKGFSSISKYIPALGSVGGLGAVGAGILSSGLLDKYPSSKQRGDIRYKGSSRPGNWWQKKR